MTNSYWQERGSCPSMVRSGPYDLVIVGGGLTGLSTAYWALKKNKNVRLAIIERRKAGHGASGRNAGFLTSGSVTYFQSLVDSGGAERAAKIWAFSEENLLTKFQEIIAGNEERLSYVQRGAFSLGCNEEQWQGLVRTAQLMQRQGIELTILDREEASRKVGTRNFWGAIQLHKEGSVDPVALLNLVKSRILESGGQVHFYEHTEFFHHHHLPNGGTLVHTSKGTMESAKLVLAQNALLPLNTPFFREKVTPVKGQILLTEPVPPVMDGPCYLAPMRAYMRQLPEGNILIGGFRHVDGDTEGAFPYLTNITPKVQDALETFIRETFPVLKDKRVVQRWAGIMGFTQNEWPLMGRLETEGEVYYLGGFSGHGMGYSFLMAKKLATLMDDEMAPGEYCQELFD